MLTIADLFWIAVVVMIATAIGSRFRQQITSGIFTFLAGVWALSYVGMVAFVVYRWYFPGGKPNSSVQVADAYLGSWWGWAAALIALGWWTRRWYVERARSQYVKGLIQAHTAQLRAAGVGDDWEDSGWEEDDADDAGPLEPEDGHRTALTKDDDTEDDGPPDPEYARRTVQIETATRWAHATTYGLVVVPLFILMLLK